MPNRSERDTFSSTDSEEVIDKSLESKSISTYEEDFDSDVAINVPIPLPSSNAPSSQGGGMIPIPVGTSSKTLLNRYYKEQLLSFLYKV